MSSIHDDLLRRVVLGELDANAPEVRASASADPGFARELAATLSVLRALERDRLEREVVLFDAGVRTAPGSEPRVPPRSEVPVVPRSEPRIPPRSEVPVAPRSEPRVPPRSEPPPAYREPPFAPRRERRAFAWSAIVAAAAAVVLVFWQPWRDDRPPHRDDFSLGDETVRCTQPVDDADDFATFRWEAPSSVGVFEVRVTDESGHEIGQGTVEGDMTWRPEAELHSRWPDRIAWRVEWIDDAGKRLGSGSAVAQRRH